VSIDAFDLTSGEIEIEGAGTIPRRACHTNATIGIAGDLDDGVGEKVGPPGRDEHGFLPCPHRVSDPRHVGGDDGQSRASASMTATGSPS
jgi:hypothetical protein